MMISVRWYRLSLALAAAGAFAAPGARAQDTTRVGPPLARIDFQDADLRAVITAIAEVGGLNVTYGEMPSRRVTLHLAPGTEDLKACQTIPGTLESLPSSPTAGGWCYVDPQTPHPSDPGGALATAIVDKCPETQKHTIRFVNADTSNKDLFISNGYVRDYTNMDFIKYSLDKPMQEQRQDRKAVVTNYISNMPSIVKPNFIFRKIREGENHFH